MVLSRAHGLQLAFLLSRWVIFRYIGIDWRFRKAVFAALS